MEFFDTIPGSPTLPESDQAGYSEHSYRKIRQARAFLALAYGSV
jgi:hypothetical protein